MDKRYIYIVFSSTPNRIGRTIRAVTGEAYNHASIALDEKLTRMYGFARRYYRTPLYGGFVRETLSRYHHKGQSSHFCVCRLPVTDEQYCQLDALLTEMFENREHYLYNHLSAVVSLFRCQAKAKDAYTCIEFIVQLLCDLGLPLEPGRHYTVCNVLDILKPYEVYNGPIAQDEYDLDFYKKHPVPYPLWTTMRDMFKLLPRLGK